MHLRITESMSKEDAIALAKKNPAWIAVSLREKYYVACKMKTIADISFDGQDLNLSLVRYENIAMRPLSAQ